MFSLIITVISIALVAALAVSTLYFGGDAFNSGSDKAKASTIVNQAQQIDAANTIHRLDNGAYLDSLSGLVTEGYLGSEPTVDASIGGTWSVTTANVIELDAVPGTVCEQINLMLDVNSIPADAASVSNQYGCHGTDYTGTGTFVMNPGS